MSWRSRQDPLGPAARGWSPSILRSDACRVTNSEKKRRRKFPRDIAGSRCNERMVASENRSQRAVFVGLHGVILLVERYEQTKKSIFCIYTIGISATLAVIAPLDSASHRAGRSQVRCRLSTVDFRDCKLFGSLLINQSRQSTLKVDTACATVVRHY